nr:hypothetical protein CFP56_69460 [Quercus suber]
MRTASTLVECSPLEDRLRPWTLEPLPSSLKNRNESSQGRSAHDTASLCGRVETLYEGSLRVHKDLHDL